MQLRVCVVTGSRADYGYLHWPMKLLQDAPDFNLQVAVTGMHLDPTFGETWKDIKRDGFPIDFRVETLTGGDSARAITEAIGRGVAGFAGCFEALAPDYVMVLGDRYEILAAVEAALIARIPVAHIAGGDASEGAFDESIRHAITKMSHLHFVTNERAAVRVRQMGENPEHVYHVGSSSLDYIRNAEFWDRGVVFEKIGMMPRARNILITFHPATLDPVASVAQAAELLAALDALGPDFGLVMTGSNADTEGRALTAAMSGFAQARGNAIFCESLGQALYVNALNQVDAVVGNSSSGLYEAPSFGIATVNIGERQKGRIRASSVYDCAIDRVAITATLKTALAADHRNTSNPYGDGKASSRILAALRAVQDPGTLIQKAFFDA